MKKIMKQIIKNKFEDFTKYIINSDNSLILLFRYLIGTCGILIWEVMFYIINFYKIYTRDTKKICDITVFINSNKGKNLEGPIPDGNYTNKLMSWNIHNGCNFYERTMIDKQCDFIKNTNADIICLQEVLNDNYIPQENYLISKLKPNYTSFYYSTEQYGVSNIGNMIISKYEILDTRICVFDKWLMRPINNAIFIKINKVYNEEKSEDIWICNLHLSSDITLLQQKHQLRQLEEFIESNNLKNIILVGDFNIPYNLFNNIDSSLCNNIDSSLCNNIDSSLCNKIDNTIIETLKNDISLESNLKSFPSYRPQILLDYYYTDLNNINDYNILKTDLSDHLPFTISI